MLLFLPDTDMENGSFRDLLDKSGNARLCSKNKRKRTLLSRL